MKESFITDNPFRLVGTGSALSQQQLRRKADAAYRSALVGLNTASPLEAEFGADDIADLVATVRSLATAPKRRTAYRIMWPLSENAIPYIYEGVSSTIVLAPEEMIQLTFLSCWYRFLRDKTSSISMSALKAWTVLYNEIALDERLKMLIMEDDNLNEDDANQQIIESQYEIARHLLKRTSSIAAQEWEAGNLDSAIGIIEAVLNSSFDETMQEEALEPLIGIGQNIAEKVEQLTLDLPPYIPGASMHTPSVVTDLERLSIVISRRHPISGGWAHIVNQWYSTFGWTLRKAALELNEQNDNIGALALAEKALSVVRDPEVKEYLFKDRITYQQNLANLERDKPYAEIEPILNSPSLYTINGIGTTLYGAKSFPPDQRLQYSILYFVFLYIPIFPLNRYVVEAVGNSQWKFYGAVKWTREMKIHLVTSSVLILLCLFLMRPAAYTEPSYTADKGLSTSAPTTIPTNKESDTDSDTQLSTDPNKSSPNVIGLGSSAPEKSEDSTLSRRKQHRQHLEYELKVWKTNIQSVKSELAIDDIAIDNEKTSLESLKATIDSKRPDNQIQQEVDDYNALVESYEVQRKDFNTHVERHNSKLEASREAVRRHNAIVDELNKDR